MEPAAARLAGGRPRRHGRKGQPWKLPDGFQAAQYERTRKAAAALIGADPDDVALISSVGYGVSTAGKVLPIPRGSRVIVLENDHTSPVLEWIGRAEAGGFTVDTVKQPTDGDWTSAVLDGDRAPGRARRWRWRRSPRCTGRTAARSICRASATR